MVSKPMHSRVFSTISLVASTLAGRRYDSISRAIVFANNVKHNEALRYVFIMINYSYNLQGVASTYHNLGEKKERNSEAKQHSGTFVL